MEYFSESANLLIIGDTFSEEAAYSREFTEEVLNLYFLTRIWYLGAYLGARYYMEGWVWTQVEVCVRGVGLLAKVASQHP